MLKDRSLPEEQTSSCKKTVTVWRWWWWWSVRRWWDNDDDDSDNSKLWWTPVPAQWEPRHRSGGAAQMIPDAQPAVPELGWRSLSCNTQRPIHIPNIRYQTFTTERKRATQKIQLIKHRQIQPPVFSLDGYSGWREKKNIVMRYINGMDKWMDGWESRCQEGKRRRGGGSYEECTDLKEVSTIRVAEGGVHHEQNLTHS